MSNTNPKIQGLAPVLSAVSGNLVIAILKIIGFLYSGSASMFSEAIHSIADTANQGLLYVGLKRSVMASDDGHDYGHGRERFIWALISACGIFFVGAGITVYHGIEQLLHGDEFEFNLLALFVLAVSFVVESITLFVALKELKNSYPNKSIYKAMKQGDPATVAVVYEDSIGVVGVFIAFICIILAHLTGQTYFDAIGSILVGLMLGAMAIMLINKNRELLVGKSIPEEIEDKFFEIMYADPLVEKVIDFKSTILDINVYRIKCEIEFNGSALMREMFEQGDLKEEYDEIKDDYEEYVKHCLNLIDRTPRVVGKKIDELENKIKAALPSIKHIDIEVN